MTQAAAFQAEKAKYDATLGGLEAQLAAAQASLAARAGRDRPHRRSSASLLTAQIDKTQQKLDRRRRRREGERGAALQAPDQRGVMDLIGSADGAGAGRRGEAVPRAGRRRSAGTTSRARTGCARRSTSRSRSSTSKQQQADARTRRGRGEGAGDRVARSRSSRRARRCGARAGGLRGAGRRPRRAEQAADEGELAAEDARVRALLGRRSSNDGPPMGSGQFLRPVGNAPDHERLRVPHRPGHRGAGLPSGHRLRRRLRHADQGGGQRQRRAQRATTATGTATRSILNHGGGLATLYGHQSAVAVGRARRSPPAR